MPSGAQSISGRLRTATGSKRTGSRTAWLTASAHAQRWQEAPAAGLVTHRDQPIGSAPVPCLTSELAAQLRCSGPRRQPRNHAEKSVGEHHVPAACHSADPRAGRSRSRITDRSRRGARAPWARTPELEPSPTESRRGLNPPSPAPAPSVFTRGRDSIQTRGTVIVHFLTLDGGRGGTPEGRRWPREIVGSVR